MWRYLSLCSLSLAFSLVPCNQLPKEESETVILGGPFSIEPTRGEIWFLRTAPTLDLLPERRAYHHLAQRFLWEEISTAFLIAYRPLSLKSFRLKKKFVRRIESCQANYSQNILGIRNVQFIQLWENICVMCVLFYAEKIWLSIPNFHNCKYKCQKSICFKRKSINHLSFNSSALKSPLKSAFSV